MLKSRPIAGRSRGTLRTAWFALLVCLPSAASRSAVIGEPDRELVEDWAEARGIDPSVAGALFAPTGEVVCRWDDPATGARTSYSTGQITLARDILTMSGHPFLDPLSCLPKAEPGGCTFTTSIAGEVVTARVTAIEALGINCNQPRRPLEERLEADWAVVRLDRSLDVVPYVVAADAPSVLVAGAPVRSVVFSQDYLTLVAGEETHPKTVGDCTVRDVLLRQERLAYFTTDCDGAQRSSGGTILAVGDGPPTLLGLWAASNEETGLLMAAVARITAEGGYRDDLANTGDYDVNHWSSRHIPVTGAFLNAIMAAAALR